MKQARLFVGAMLGLAVVAVVSPVMAGDLNPPGPPAPTMKTLNQVTPTWDQFLPAYDSTTPDGCNSSRFKCVLNDAAVLDKETGLVWEKSPLSPGPGPGTTTWSAAIVYCFIKAVGGRKGWRLPAIEELASLVAPGVSNPALPAGHPFANVQLDYYWSATSTQNGATYAWRLTFGDGSMDWQSKAGTYYVWCVRGGRGYDGQ